MIINNLCVLYPGLNPLTLTKTSYHDVLVMYADVRRMQIREAQTKDKPRRRRASDDAGWW
ncbi:MAG: hypothetical protein ACLR62_05810 [Coprococcus sp.]|uniref:hypothetical protein n=1 Tax=Coprococcus sp. RTP21281st1_F1_RTP21281_210402 TaxID=3143208 RepID=UPI002051E41E|nr:MAG TPA: hypothetical protein [Caudoviricetes sp.]